jgi:hypothetical protein
LSYGDGRRRKRRWRRRREDPSYDNSNPCFQMLERHGLIIAEQKPLVFSSGDVLCVAPPVVVVAYEAWLCHVAAQS